MVKQSLSSGYVRGNTLSKEQCSEDEELNKIASNIKFEEFIKMFISHLQEDHKFGTARIKAYFEIKTFEKNTIPISVFNNNELGCLETIVKYLKEYLKLRYHEIAVLLNRNDRTVWTTYNVANKKRKKALLVKESHFSIPISIFENRSLSAFELIVKHLKENFNLRYSQIAELLNRDERNIWTVYNRALKRKNE